MQAIILAGGKGTRLKPYTTVFPKPLMPVGVQPILEIMIRQLKYYGINNIILAVGHLKNLIQAFFNDGKKWGVDISYSVEDKAMGTAAPLKLIKKLDPNFLVMNGDILTNLDFKKFFLYHEKNNALCTISMYQKHHQVDLGIIKKNEKEEIFDYIEKPSLNYCVSMGIYAFKRDVVHSIPDNEYFDFPDLVKKLLKEGKKILGYSFNGLWFDIGRPEDYEVAAEEFEKNKDEYLKEK